MDCEDYRPTLRAWGCLLMARILDRTSVWMDNSEGRLLERLCALEDRLRSMAR